MTTTPGRWHVSHVLEAVEKNMGHGLQRHVPGTKAPEPIFPLGSPALDVVPAVWLKQRDL